MTTEVQAGQGNPSSGPVLASDGLANQKFTVGGLPEDVRGLTDWSKFEGKPAAEVFKSYALLQKLQGQSIPLPKGPDDVEGLRTFRERWGVPSEATGYTLDGLGEKAQLVNPEMKAWFADLAHEANMSQKDFEKVVARYMEKEVQVNQGREKEKEILKNKNIEEMKKGWGIKYEDNMGIVQRYMAEMPDNLRQKFEGVGFNHDPVVAEWLLGIAKTREDHEFVVGESGGRIPKLTPDQAKEKIGMLMKDKAWVESYQKGDKFKTEEFTALNKMAYPSKR